jgi:hypothetical protein
MYVDLESRASNEVLLNAKDIRSCGRNMKLEQKRSNTFQKRQLFAVARTD